MSLQRQNPMAGAVVSPACYSILIRWTECLHGDGNLRETLAALADLAQARVVFLHRTTLATGVQRPIASFDRDASVGARPITRGLGLALSGRFHGRAKPGTVWVQHDLDRLDIAQLDARVLDWQTARDLHDAITIPLGGTADAIDVVEMHLTARLDPARHVQLTQLAAAMSEAWERRPNGRIARILRAVPAIAERLKPADLSRVNPLSPSNPFGLTAAESRICGVIREGLGLAEVGQRLGVTDSTLRSHLRSVYAKVGVAGQVGLLRLLLDPEQSVGQGLAAGRSLSRG